MTAQLPTELAHVRELMDQAKLDEAFEIIEHIENDESFSPEDQAINILDKVE